MSLFQPIENVAKVWYRQSGTLIKVGRTILLVGILKQVLSIQLLFKNSINYDGESLTFKHDTQSMLQKLEKESPQRHCEPLLYMSPKSESKLTDRDKGDTPQRITGEKQKGEIK